MQAFEKLGSFYLSKEYDLAKKKLLDLFTKYSKIQTIYNIRFLLF
jgi:hypothetical protein